MLRLALTFGIPPRELLTRLSGEDVRDYIAMDSVMPIGELGAQWRNAMQIASVAGESGKPLDTYLWPPLKDWYADPDNDTEESRIGKIAGIVQAMNAAGITRKTEVVDDGE